MRKRYLLVMLILVLAVTTAQAQRPDAPRFAQPGPYSVGTTDFQIGDAERPLRATIWYPAEAQDTEPITYRLGIFSLVQGRAVSDSPPAEGSFPLVIFSHGLGGFRFQSVLLMEHLASHGFVVIAADHPGSTTLDDSQIPLNYAQRPFDMLRLIDHAPEINDDLAAIIDMDRIALAGHSFGGYTALAASGARLNFGQLDEFCRQDDDDVVCFLLESEAEIAAARGLDEIPSGPWPATTDPRIKAVVVFAPWNGPILDSVSLAQIDIPALFMVGTTDQTTPPERDAFTIFNNMANSPRTLVTLENADHFIFVDACYDFALESEAFFEMCSDPVWDMSRAHDLINHFTTAFLTGVLVDGTQSPQLAPEENDFRAVDYIQRGIGPAPEILLPRIVEAYSHDTEAFTQGLLFYDGKLYESTGRYGQSQLRRVELATGETEQSIDISAEFFAEGLARVDDRLIQITWQENTAFVYNLDTFEQIDQFSYEGEGWGLCYNGETLMMSDGTSVITERDPETFEVLRRVEVTVQGQPIDQINELECVGDRVYANIWQENLIIRFDPESGLVDQAVNATGLLPPATQQGLPSGAVLNGIAYDPDNEVFYITGKLWPNLFEVEFVSP